MQRWLAVLPADLVRSRPRLLLAQAPLAVASGRVEAGRPLLGCGRVRAPQLGR